MPAGATDRPSERARAGGGAAGGAPATGPLRASAYCGPRDPGRAAPAARRLDPPASCENEGADATKAAAAISCARGDRRPSWPPLRHGLGAADGHDVEGANSTTYVTESALGGRGPRAPQRELEPNAAGAYRSGEPGEEAATDEVYRRWDTDEVAGWILVALPFVFQNESGDPYHFKSAKPGLVTWGLHVLRVRDCPGRRLDRVE